MITNIKITLSKDTSGRFIAKLIKAQTLTNITDLTVCECGKPYPKPIKITDTEYLIPIEKTIRQDYTYDTYSSNQEELINNITYHISNCLNVNPEEVRHGVKFCLRETWGKRQCSQVNES